MRQRHMGRWLQLGPGFMWPLKVIQEMKPMRNRHPPSPEIWQPGHSLQSSFHKFGHQQMPSLSNNRCVIFFREHVFPATFLLSKQASDSSVCAAACPRARPCERRESQQVQATSYNHMQGSDKNKNTGTSAHSK